MFDTNIKSMYDLLKTFPDEQSCINYLESLRWAGRPVSPFDPTSKVYKCAANKYKCKNTAKYFNVRTGTMYDNTKIELQKWFLAVWLITSHKKGISSLQLGRDLNITQKSAWFMAQRIRACFGIENNDAEQFEGIVEADETFVGGKNKNRHKDKKVAASQGRAFKDKTPVLGILQRGEKETVKRPHKLIAGKTVVETIVHSHSKVRCIVASNTKKDSIQPFIKGNVLRDSVLISDEWLGYRGLESTYDHHVVDHGKKQYVDFDNPEIHSNSIESFWGIMKRSYNGIHNWWSKKHMQKYVDEHVYRFNLRHLKDGDRFGHLLANSGVRTKYKDLIS